MPIYAYRCDACGFEQDVLQKLSDAPLKECPSCHALALQKQVTAAGFQLKGSGWYATDFRNNKPAPGAGKDGEPAAKDTEAAVKDGEASAKPADAGAADKAPATPAPAAAESAGKKGGTEAAAKSSAAAAPTPGPASH
jgi:putative FmdB family regulatory protein